MDPNATLKEMLEFAAYVLWAIENGKDPDDYERDALGLAEHAIELDTWLSKGGFLPEAWERK